MTQKHLDPLVPPLPSVVWHKKRVKKPSSTKTTKTKTKKKKKTRRSKPRTLAGGTNKIIAGVKPIMSRWQGITGRQVDRKEGM